MPNGYERLLVLMMAVEIMPEFGIENAQLFQMAMKAKSDIKRTNARPSVMRVSLPFGKWECC